jgi:hypothetical protein
MTRIKRFLPLILFTAGLFLLPASVALSNSAPPNAHIWFVFKPEAADTPLPIIQSAQLINYAESDPATIEHIYQYGDCTDKKCFAPSRTESNYSNLECANDRCLFTYDYYSLQKGPLPPVSRLLVQFADATRLSAPFTQTVDDSYELLIWQATLTPQALDLTLQSSTQSFDLSFALIYLFSVTIEALVAVGFVFLRRTDWKSRYFLLGTILVINILSYPIVWIGIPALMELQTEGTRSMGIYITWITLIYTFALLAVALSKGGTQKIAGIVTLSTLPFACLFSFVLNLSYHFRDYMLVDQGLSPQLALFLAELFAVTFEGALLYLLHRKTIPLWQIALYSLLANLASFLAGWIIFR